MRRLEIIHLRSSGALLDSLIDGMIETIGAEGDRSNVVTLYRRNGLESDVAIHIQGLDRTGEEVPSTLGLRLASELKAFGLVEHSVWEELK